MVNRLRCNVTADIAQLAAGNCHSNSRQANCPACIRYASEGNDENADSHHVANPHSHY